MKKFLSIIFLCFVFCVCGFNNVFFEYLVDLDKNSKVCFYCSERNQTGFVQEIQNGQGYVYETTNEKAKDIYKTLKGCYGFSIRLGATALDDILKNVHIVKTEKLEGLENFYCMANGLMFFDFLDNKKINIQIAKTSSGVIVGSPIILGSY